MGEYVPQQQVLDSLPPEAVAHPPVAGFWDLINRILDEPFSGTHVVVVVGALIIGVSYPTIRWMLRRWYKDE